MDSKINRIRETEIVQTHAIEDAVTHVIGMTGIPETTEIPDSAEMTETAPTPEGDMTAQTREAEITAVIVARTDDHTDATDPTAEREVKNDDRTTQKCTETVLTNHAEIFPTNSPNQCAQSVKSEDTPMRNAT